MTASEVAWHSEPVLLPLKADIANLDEAALLAHVTNDEGVLGNTSDPRTVYPRLRAARDLEFARRVRAGRQIELTCLSFGSAACVLGMPGELFVEYQLQAQELAAEIAARSGGSEPAVLMAAYGDIGPGYIGTAESYSYGPKCYETGAPSRVSAGSAPLLMRT